jgi:hypothetical protein
MAFSLVAGGGALAAPLSPLDELLIENQINQKLALYTLLADGDGIRKMDARAMADQIFTPDAVFENYSQDGKLGISRNGREVIYRMATEHAMPANAPIADRHYNVSTYFDVVTPTMAKTRTIAIVLNATKNMIGPDCAKSGEDACGGKLVHAYTFTYHDTWVKTADGWQKSHSVLRSDE